MFEAFRNLVNTDPALARLGRYYSVAFTVLLEEQAWRFDVRNGELASLTHVAQGADTDAVFTLTIDPKSWEAFGTQTPPPGYHDISAMIEHRHARLSGDYLPWLANMTFVKGLIRHLRAHYDALCLEGSAS